MDTASPVTGRRPALKVLTARVAGAHSTVLVGLLSLLLGAFTGLPMPEAVEQDRAAQIESLRQCPSVVSADNRLLTERWAASEDCEKPLRTRVTDRFLGFTCTEGLSDTVACRAFLPLPGSRAFDTSRYFRCVDLGVTDTELGIVFSKMREWVEFSKACDWSRSRELPAMEVDFVTGRTCVTPGGLCFPVHLLSPIGKVRLRLSIEKALREFGLVRSGRLGTDAYPVPAYWSKSLVAPSDGATRSTSTSAPWTYTSAGCARRSCARGGPTRSARFVEPATASRHAESGGGALQHSLSSPQASRARLA